MIREIRFLGVSGLLHSGLVVHRAEELVPDADEEPQLRRQVQTTGAQAAHLGPPLTPLLHEPKQTLSVLKGNPTQ